MNPEYVAAQVRERSGLDVQAVTLVRSGNGDQTMPSVWAAMTELGHFWAVEDGQTIELFRAVARKTAPTDLLACHSAVEAARRFLMLHPPAHVTMPRRAEPDADRSAHQDASPAPAPVAQHAHVEEPVGGQPTCQTCGATLTSRALLARTRAGDASRLLCSRCRHAEHERLRYQQDPTYRARRLAYSAARYRRGQQAASQES